MRNDLISDESELGILKATPLACVARKYGWSIDQQASSHRYQALRRGDSKINVNVANRCHIWNDNAGAGGSVIDFVMFEERCSLGQARKILRSMNGSLSPASHSSSLPPAACSSGSQLFDPTIFRPPGASIAAYLRHRQVGERIMRNAVKQGGIQSLSTGRYNNAVFVHSDAVGIVVGGEIRNHGWKSFAGQKTGLFQFRSSDAVRSVVVTESAIDALSFAELHQDSHDHIVSTGGTPSQAQLMTLVQVIKAHANVKVNLAQDNDSGGGKQAEMVMKVVEQAGYQTIRLVPALGKDWNEMLCIEKQRESEQEDEHVQ